jgi:hypothetical protein
MRTLGSMGGCLLLTAALALPALGAAPAKEAPKMTPEQQKMMDAWMKAGTPGPEHARLGQMAGTWKMQITSYDGPTPHTDEGTAVFTAGLGGRVVTQAVTSTMNGMPYQGSGTEGYDNVSKKYWSIWTDNMSTGPMTSWGTCDAAGACTYTATYNDAMTGKPAKARLTLKPDGPDKSTFTMFGPGPGGKEVKMMEIVYTRQK